MKQASDHASAGNDPGGEPDPQRWLRCVRTRRDAPRRDRERTRPPLQDRTAPPASSLREGASRADDLATSERNLISHTQFPATWRVRVAPIMVYERLKMSSFAGSPGLRSGERATGPEELNHRVILMTPIRAVSSAGDRERGRASVCGVEGEKGQTALP